MRVNNVSGHSLDIHSHAHSTSLSRIDRRKRDRGGIYLEDYQDDIDFDNNKHHHYENYRYTYNPPTTIRAKSHGEYPYPRPRISSLFLPTYRINSLNNKQQTLSASSPSPSSSSSLRIPNLRDISLTSQSSINEDNKFMDHLPIDNISNKDQTEIQVNQYETVDLTNDYMEEKIANIERGDKSKLNTNQNDFSINNSSNSNEKRSEDSFENLFSSFRNRQSNSGRSVSSPSSKLVEELETEMTEKRAEKARMLAISKANQELENDESTTLENDHLDELISLHTTCLTVRPTDNNPDNDIDSFSNSFQYLSIRREKTIDQFIEEIKKKEEEEKISGPPFTVTRQQAEEIYKELLNSILFDSFRLCLKRIPLSEAQLRKAHDLLYRTPSNTVVVDCFNIEIRGKELLCLRNGEWLNDEVMNIYFELLSDRCKRKNKDHKSNQLRDIVD